MFEAAMTRSWECLKGLCGRRQNTTPVNTENDNFIIVNCSELMREKYMNRFIQSYYFPSAKERQPRQGT